MGIASSPWQGRGLYAARLRRWHRRLGLIACAGIVIWASSGALHPLLSRYQPQPAQRMAPAVDTLATSAQALATVLAHARVAQIHQARLVRMAYKTYYQVDAGDGTVRYFDVLSGAERRDGDRSYAEYLARHFLGDHASTIAAVTRLTQFDEDYVAVNRLLPVYRVDFARADGMRAYVDTGSSALATLVDRRKARFTRLFTTLHNWRFAGNGDVPRVPLAALVLACAIATPLLGLALYVAHGRHRPRPLARLHRGLGLAVAAMLLTSGASGGFHLVKGALDRAEATPALLHERPAIAISALAGLVPPAGTFSELGVVMLQGRAWYRGTGASAPSGAEHHGCEAPASALSRYRGLPDDATDIPDDVQYARALAGAFSGLPPSRIEAVEAISTFAGEYGFINKLLPVYRVAYSGPHHPRYYVHLDSATLAASIDDFDYLEGWSFAHLHKWQWLEFIGRWPRDIVMMTLALGIATTAALGFALFLRRPRG